MSKDIRHGRLQEANPVIAAPIDYMCPQTHCSHFNRKSLFWKALLYIAAIHQTMLCMLLVIGTMDAYEIDPPYTAQLPVWKVLSLYWCDHGLFGWAIVLVGFCAVCGTWLANRGHGTAGITLWFYCITAIVLVALARLSQLCGLFDRMY